MTIHSDVLDIDAERVMRQIADTLVVQVGETLKRRGLVVGLPAGSTVPWSPGWRLARSDPRTCSRF